MTETATRSYTNPQHTFLGYTQQTRYLEPKYLKKITTPTIMLKHGRLTETTNVTDIYMPNKDRPAVAQGQQVLGLPPRSPLE